MSKEIKETNDLAYLVATAIVSDKTAQETAEYLYKKGYRKQSDTIKEFAGKLKSIYSGREKRELHTRISFLFGRIDEIAKEYGAEVE